MNPLRSDGTMLSAPRMPSSRAAFEPLMASTRRRSPPPPEVSVIRIALPRSLNPAVTPTACALIASITCWTIVSPESNATVLTVPSAVVITRSQSLDAPLVGKPISLTSSLPGSVVITNESPFSAVNTMRPPETAASRYVSSVSPGVAVTSTFCIAELIAVASSIPLRVKSGAGGAGILTTWAIPPFRLTAKLVAPVVWPSEAAPACWARTSRPLFSTMASCCPENPRS